MTIFAFIAVFSAIAPGRGDGTEIGLVRLSIICLGVFLGSIAWWLVLTSVAYYLVVKIDAIKVKILSFLAGVSIALFGCYTILTAIF